MSTMPAFVAFREESREKFLGYVTEGNRKGYLEFCVDEIFDPRVKFVVENGPDGLVHIRCCYNNKYWIRSSATEDYITPEASEAEEDRKKWNCTLLKTLLMTQDSILLVNFIHKQTEHRLIATTLSKVNNSVLGIAPSNCEDGFDCSICKTKSSLRVFDYGSLVKLPRYVAFKGNNGEFLTTRYFNLRIFYHKFVAESVSDASTKHELFPTKEGHYNVKNISVNKFWKFRYFPKKMLFPDGTSNPTTASEVEVIQLAEPNFVCLRIPTDDLFLGRGFNLDALTYTLLPMGNTITPETRLEVVEPVLNRRVDNVQFRLDHARIYDRTPVTVFRAVIPNDTDRDHQHAAEVSYAKTKTISWNNGVITTSGVKTTFQTCTPYIVDGKVEVSCQISTEFKWGESRQSSEQVKSTYTVPVLAKHKTIITVLGLEAKCDIPFSYVQTDTFYDGSRMTTKFHDGVYTGIESYDFHHNTQYEPL